jgi:NitT/TauT family transport system substrate-binding protein
MKTFRFLLILAALMMAVAPIAAQEDDIGSLKVGLLPVLDTLPFYVAEEAGYFEAVGVEVEGVPIASPVERDQLMQAGAIDGMLNEITTTATFNRDEVQVQALIAARIAYDDFPIFRVLAAPDSGIETPADLAGVPIGVSMNTIIEYLTYRLLEAEGVATEDVVVESVPLIPERYQLLMQGQLEAATLPDPLAQAAIEAGAVPVIDDSSYPAYSLSTLSFSVAAIEEKPEAIRRFLLAWDMAVQDINADPEAYRALFLEQVSVPESVQETYEIPPFPRATVPSAEQWDDVIDWLIEKELLDDAVPYDTSVNPDFLPEVEEEAVDNAALESAAELYAAVCAACHGEAGEGGVGPALAGNADLDTGQEHLTDVLVNGIDGTAMAAFGDTLTADEIGGLIALVQSWNE